MLLLDGTKKLLDGAREAEWAKWKQFGAGVRVDGPVLDELLTEVYKPAPMQWIEVDKNQHLVRPSKKHVPNMGSQVSTRDLILFLAWQISFLNQTVLRQFPFRYRSPVCRGPGAAPGAVFLKPYFESVFKNTLFERVSPNRHALL